MLNNALFNKKHIQFYQKRRRVWIALKFQKIKLKNYQNVKNPIKIFGDNIISGAAKKLLSFEIAQ